MKLSKQAIEYLSSDNARSLKYWINEIQKVSKNKDISIHTKIAIKEHLSEKIKMHNEIAMYIYELEKEQK